jgi:hypothetical protein
MASILDDDDDDDDDDDSVGVDMITLHICTSHLSHFYLISNLIGANTVDVHRAGSN